MTDPTAASPCVCAPCPGRGNDGHGLSHCAECCFGSGVEADLGCPIHGDPATAASLAHALDMLGGTASDHDRRVR